MALSQKVWNQRVNAALELHGLDLKDIEDLGDGVPKAAAARAGRPADKYSPNHALALVLSERLEVPVEWFEDEDWRPLVQANPRHAEALADLAERQGLLLQAVGRLEQQVGALSRRLPPPEPAEDSG